MWNPCTDCSNPPAAGTGNDAMLYLLNCYDVWSATPRPDCGETQSDQAESE
jgi:hypothetical protein